MTKKKILQYILFFLTLVLAFLFWRSVSRAVNYADASVWYLPIIWFSLLFVVFSLSAIIIEKKYVLWILSVFSLALSLIFVFWLWHILIIIVSAIFLILAVDRIKADVTYAIKINIWKSLRTGSTIIVFAFSLVLASQYYMEIKSLPLDKLLPRLKIDSLTSKLTVKLIKYAMPNLQNLDDENLTVDQLILSNQKDQIDSLDILNKVQKPENLSEIDAAIVKSESEKIVENNKALILAESRKQLSDAAGMDLQGNEKVTEVFSQMINKKISEAVVPKIGEENRLPIVPIIVSAVLFITVFYAGYFVTPLWILLGYLVFLLLVKTKVIKIVQVPAEIEMIE